MIGSGGSRVQTDGIEEAVDTAFVHPAATGARRDLLVDWHVWLDAVRRDLRSSRGGARERVRRLRRLMPVDGEADPPGPRGALERSLADLWSRTAPGASPDWRRRYARNCDALCEEATWSASRPGAAHELNPIEYVTARRRGAPTWWSIGLLEHAFDSELRTELWRAEPLRDLRAIVVDVVALREDLHALPRAVASGSLDNGVLVLQRFLGCDAAEAAATVERAISLRVELFERTVATALPALYDELGLTASERAAACAFAGVLEGWIARDRWPVHEARLHVSTGQAVTAALAGMADGGITGDFALPDVYMPFATTCNPHVDTVRERARAWSREIGVFDSGVWDEAHYDAMDCALLSALTHPDATLGELDLICRWHIWGLFGDDLFAATFPRRDRATRSELARAAELVARQRLFMPLGPSAELVSPRTPLERMAADLWRWTSPGMPERARRQLAAHADACFRANLWELRNYSRHRVPEAIHYLEMRRMTVAAALALSLGRLCAPGAPIVRDELAAAPPLRDLIAIFADWLGIVNDIVSFSRERADNDANTAPRVLARLLRCDLPRAVTVLNDLLTARLRQFERIVAVELEPLCDELGLDDDERADVRAYATEMQQWMAGALRWAAITSRYTTPETAVEAPGASAATDILAWGTAFIAPGLRDAVRALPSEARRVVAYHHGWCDDAGRPAPGSSGKALRPTLALLSARALGGRAEDALPAAVAVELVHNFSLLHDDVMDGDAVRRSRPTAWIAFGVGPAILAGDALLAVAFDVLAATGHERSLSAIRMLVATSLRLIEGQTADLAFETRDDVELEECLRMASHKTGALLGCACALGGLLAGAREPEIERMHGFGVCIGNAFQLVDDILGIWGAPDVTGKPVYSDLRNRKKSLPVVAALRSDTAAGRELAEHLARRDPLADDELVHVAALVERAGGRAWSELEADRQRRAALHHLDVAGARGHAVEDLRALAELVTSRDR